MGRKSDPDNGRGGFSEEPESGDARRNKEYPGEGHLVLVTGGSASGKSAFAEEQIMKLCDFGNLPGNAGKERRKFYIATMYPYDLESRCRISRHRCMRAGKGFETVERYTNLAGLQLPEGGCVLLECMSNLVANEMFLEEGAGEDTVEQILLGVRKICSQADFLVIVTNEIFSETMAYQGDTKRYQRYLGEINCRLAAQAEEVVEVVFGIPVYHKKGNQTESEPGR